jgi:hypothetical protein
LGRLLFSLNDTPLVRQSGRIRYSNYEILTAEVFKRKCSSVSVGAIVAASQPKTLAAEGPESSCGSLIA